MTRLALLPLLLVLAGPAQAQDLAAAPEPSTTLFAGSPDRPDLGLRRGRGRFGLDIPTYSQEKQERVYYRGYLAGGSALLIGGSAAVAVPLLGAGLVAAFADRLGYSVGFPQELAVPVVAGSLCAITGALVLAEGKRRQQEHRARFRMSATGFLVTF